MSKSNMDRTSFKIIKNSWYNGMVNLIRLLELANGQCIGNIFFFFKTTYRGLNLHVLFLVTVILINKLT